MHDLTGLLAYWQRQLRLQDWEIRLRVVRYHEVDGSPLGVCRVRHTTRDAEILLLDPGDYQPHHDERDRDQELTLVHELLHVLFPGDEDGGVSSAAQEQAIEACARALVGLNRGVRR